MTDPNPIDVATGAKVRLVRERKRLSQTALGEAIGVSFQQVQKYERGANRISVSALVGIGRALGVSPSEFLPDETAQGEPPPTRRQPQFEVIFEDDIDGAVLRIGLQHAAVGRPYVGMVVDTGAIEVTISASPDDVDGIIDGLRHAQSAAKRLERSACTGLAARI